MIAVDLSVERNLSARKQAHRNVGLADCRKSARAGFTEPGCDQLVADLSGSIRNMVQTVVTHRRYSCCEQPGWLSFSGEWQQITVALLCRPRLSGLAPCRAVTQHPADDPR